LLSPRVADGVQHAVDATACETAGHRCHRSLRVAATRLPPSRLRPRSSGYPLEAVRQSAVQERLLEAFVTNPLLRCTCPPARMVTSSLGCSQPPPAFFPAVMSRGPASCAGGRGDSRPCPRRRTSPALRKWTSHRARNHRLHVHIAEEGDRSPSFPCGMKRSERHSRMSGWMPDGAHSFTLCWVAWS